MIRMKLFIVHYVLPTLGFLYRAPIIRSSQKQTQSAAAAWFASHVWARCEKSKLLITVESSY